MADLNRLYDALRNADAAGDTEAAKKLADYIRTVQTAPVAAEATKAAPPSPTDGEGFLSNLAAGGGKAITDLGMGIKQRYSDMAAAFDRNMPGQDLRAKIGEAIGTGNPQQWQADTQAAIDEKKRLDVPLMQTTGGKVGNFIGMVVPSVAAMAIPGGQTLAGAVLTGAALGAAEPTATGESALRNAGAGAAGGAAGYGAAKLIGATVNGVKSLAQPFYDSGKNAIVGRRILEAAGSEADQQAAMRALSNAGELVPGSAPTAGQAAGNAGIAALERTAAATDPAVTQAYAARMAEQNAARVAALEDVAGTHGARDFFAADRETVANQLYEQARKAGIDPAVLTPEAMENIAAMQARIPQTVIDRAKELAQINGTPMTDATSIDGMHWVKRSLDSLIKKAKTSGDSDLAAAYTGLQKDYVEGMGRLSPDYDVARQTYAVMSKPVNQMDVAQAIADKSKNALTGNLQPNAYAKALSDQTAARATGFPGATLENTLEPAQLKTLQAIEDDLRRAHFAQNAGRGPGSDTVQKLAYANIANGFNVPAFVRTFSGPQVVANVGARFADAAYGRANKELSQRLAESLLDTSTTQKIMQDTIRSIENSSMVDAASSAIAPYASALSGAGILGQVRNNH